MLRWWKELVFARKVEQYFLWKRKVRFTISLRDNRKYLSERKKMLKMHDLFEYANLICYKSCTE